MRFTYKTEEQLQQEKPMLAEGGADFEIKTAEEKVSKNGNPMIECKIQVWDKNGASGVIFDYIVSNLSFKIKSVCDSIGHPEWYAPNVDLEAQALVGQTGKCFLKLERSQDVQYPPRMKISYYIEAQEETTKVAHNLEKRDDRPSASSKDDGFDDDIPF